MMKLTGPEKVTGAMLMEPVSVSDLLLPPVTHWSMLSSGSSLVERVTESVTALPIVMIHSAGKTMVSLTLSFQKAIFLTGSF